MIGWWLMAASMAVPPTGTWVLAESPETVQARVDEAVEVAAAEFGIFRAIARPRISRVAIWCKQYRLDFESDPVTYRCDDIDPLEVAQTQLGTAFTLALPRGEVQTTVTWTEPALTVSYESDDGGRTNVFQFNEEGTMALMVTVRSARLSAPVTFQIPYQAAP